MKNVFCKLITVGFISAFVAGCASRDDGMGDVWIGVKRMEDQRRVELAAAKRSTATEPVIKKVPTY